MVEAQKEKYKILVMAILLGICCFLAGYVHAVLGVEIIYTHFFYIPIILASLWWKRKGLVVAIFLALLLLFTHLFHYGFSIVGIDDIVRASFFIIVAYVIGLVSEREAKRKEEIAKERDKSQGILKAIGEAIFLVDKDMNVVEVNAARLRIFDVNREDVIGKKCYRAFWNNEEICANCPVPSVFENGEESCMERTLATFADGTLKHLDVIYVPIFDEKGNVVQVICDMRDITERKRAEEALAASKAYTESIIQNFLDTLIVVDTEVKIQTVNPATCELLGYTEEELIGQPISIIFAEEEEEEEDHRFFQFFREPKKTEALRPQDTIRNRELTYKTKDGRLIPMSFNASVLTDEAGNVTHVVAGAKNITELKLAEAEIIREKNFSENIVATVPDSLLVLDTDLRIKSANRTFYEKFQTEPETVTGTRITDILPEDGKKLSSELTRLFGTEDMLENFELQYQSEKLGERIFNITARGILIAEEEEEEELLVIEDITERKRMEKVLQESEEKYRSLVESTEDSVYLMDRNCRYLFVNDKHLSRLGFTMDEIRGRTYGELHSPEEEEELVEKVEEVFETGKSVQHEHRSRRDGRYFIRTLSPVKDSEGITTAVTVVSKDTTERKRAEEQVEASLREKETLLKEIHHRVKNNFQVISSLLNLQSEYIEDKHASELFKISQNRINTMALIHEELYQSEDLARIDFAEYIRKLVTELYSSYGVNFETIKRNINVENILLGIDKAIPCGLIINELVSNSFKHAFPKGKGGAIQIAMHPLKGNEVELIIRDDGIGFPKDLDFRNTETLGMQLVVRLTNQLDGTIELDKSGGGTTFKITFAK